MSTPDLMPQIEALEQKLLADVGEKTGCAVYRAL